VLLRTGASFTVTLKTRGPVVGVVVGVTSI